MILLLRRFAAATQLRSVRPQQNIFHKQGEEEQMLTYGEIVIRLFLSALLGSIVGLERERLDWAAGLRTHMLVSVGATVFMLVSAFGFSDVLGHSNVVLDPSRVAAQVVSGIGFLGAGTIIF